MRSSQKIVYFWLIVFALFTAGCNFSLKFSEDENPARAKIQKIKDDDQTYHQKRMKEMDGPGWTDLHRAAARWDAVEVQKLLDQGVSVDSPLQHGETPLYEATRRGKLEVMKLLMKNGADVDVAGRSGTAPYLLLLNIIRLRRYGCY